MNLRSDSLHIDDVDRELRSQNKNLTARKAVSVDQSGEDLYEVT